ncbi:MAG: adenine deaminase [Methanobacteriaceae archaeon]|uniref:Adenine deaminase n=1 Tax=Methanothermobacter tenebrarum TaxID=680118 RepID=A0A328PI94_9EURY|nr:adenine deaminase [Methanothermobacter tenebrarum]NPV64923.1 adenine deaminase [Methanobacteriaceae archaeon]RAO79386.1 adenine deaminase [Methanothermobacter tenebrarum]
MLKGNILNVFTGDIYPAEIIIEDGMIKIVRKIEGDFDGILLPGFIDSHTHIESSLMTPSSFAEATIPHGTTAVISDPHEIANVMGLEGIDFMIEDSKRVPLKFFFTAPSCVPPTEFETAGANIGVNEIRALLERDEIVALGEMMDFPGVISEDPQVIDKIKAAKKARKPIDGHAPLLSGDDLCKYVEKGISTDHESVYAEEAQEKIELGMKIMIREGSSAKNLQELAKVGGDFLVSDDVEPGDLIEGHMDMILRKAVEYGIDEVEAVRMVTINPADHYSLDSGAIAPGRPADIVLVDNLKNFTVKKVFINGELVAKDGEKLFKVKGNGKTPPQGKIRIKDLKSSRLEIRASGSKARVRVIKVFEEQIITSESTHELPIKDGIVQPLPEDDILKVSVIDRYGHGNIGNGFVEGFGIREGALASTVAHDSHNLIVVGTSTDYMMRAVEILRRSGGGLVAVAPNESVHLRLPVAGLMSHESVNILACKARQLNDFVADMGSSLSNPFMTMSFLSLLVIPQLRLSDRGLFNVEERRFVDPILS